MIEHWSLQYLLKPSSWQPWPGAKHAYVRRWAGRFVRLPAAKSAPWWEIGAGDLTVGSGRISGYSLVGGFIRAGRLVGWGYPHVGVLWTIQDEGWQGAFWCFSLIKSDRHMHNRIQMHSVGTSQMLDFAVDILATIKRRLLGSSPFLGAWDCGGFLGPLERHHPLYVSTLGKYFAEDSHGS